MNTKNKQNEKNQKQRIRQGHEPKKQGQNRNMQHYHEQEHAETRMTR